MYFLNSRIKVAMKDNVASEANLIYTIMEETPGETVTVSKDVLSSLIGTIVRTHDLLVEQL
jgi:hypothetical protein